jgi:hypothetical protein
MEKQKTNADSSTETDSAEKQSIDQQRVIAGLNFGRVDAESDSRFDHCFIGTETLRQVLLPQHSLVLGSKGSGKSAAFRLLCDDLQRVKTFLPQGYNTIIPVPAYGLQSEEFLPGVEIRALKSKSVDEFRYFWLLYIGLKTIATLLQDSKIEKLISKSKNEKLKSAYQTFRQVLDDIGIPQKRSMMSKLRRRFGQIINPASWNNSLLTDEVDNIFSDTFRHKTGMSVMALLDNVDTILRETNCLAWVMLDKLDLLFIDDFEKLKAAITGLVQLLVEHGNRFKHIHFKIFLRNDIYRQLHIVNKSHLISYTSEMKWREPLLLKLLVSRAVADPVVREYCEEVSNEKVEVASVIEGADEYVLHLFYIIFEATMDAENGSDSVAPFTHIWIFKHLIDGMGNIYPRELIHLGNLAVEKQREINRIEGQHQSTRLISANALKEAFAAVSVYRCDTYLYSEFPHLAKHFDIFRGSDKATFQRKELYQFFEHFAPNGDEAIRAVYDAGLLTPLGHTVDSSVEFNVPLLYRTGLGITQRESKIRTLPKSRSVEDETVGSIDNN